MAWIASNPKQWNVFVENRVAEIRKLSRLEEWEHVRTGDNPADIVSRGCSPKRLLESQPWWKGPARLTSERGVPLYVADNSNPLEEIPERRKTVAANAATVVVSVIPYDRFSSWRKLTRVIASKQ